MKKARTARATVRACAPPDPPTEGTQQSYLDRITWGTSMPELNAHQIARVGEVTADLTWISRSWQDLHLMRFPGARRPRRAPVLTAAARADADATARTDRRLRDPDAPGESPAPIDVTVLDTLTGLLLTLDDLARRLADTAAAAPDEFPRPATMYDFLAIGPLTETIRALLADATQADPEALDDAQEVVAGLRRRLAEATADVDDGQRLHAVCPWCRGTTVDAPTGGERTLVVRLVAGRPLILCEGALCDPPAADCHIRVRGRPGWSERSWPWLARRLEAAA